MRTSGGGSRDLTMLTVPVLMLVAYVVLNAGGVMSLLKSVERRLWATVDWLSQLIA